MGFLNEANPSANGIDQLIPFLDSFASEDGGILQKEELQPLKRAMRERLFHESDRLRLMLVGEFKAGKSTLLNALLGEECAAVDILEMTSWIARYVKADTRFCQIVHADGTTKEMSPEEFHHRTSNRAFTDAELSLIERVDLGIVDAEVPFVLVDTPGLGSVTRENERRLLLALDEADVLVWTIDVTSLGGVREAALAERLVESRVPRLAVLTKCDEVEDDEELDEISEEVADLLDIDETHVFITSASRAIDRLRAGLKPDDRSGVPALREFLGTEMAPRQTELRKKAAAAHSMRMRDHAITLLDRVVTDLEARKEKIESFADYIDATRERVQRAFEREVTSFVRDNMFGDRQPELTAELANKMKKKGALSPEALSEMFRRHLGEGHMDSFWKEVTEVVCGKAAERWTEQLDDEEVGFRKMFELVQEEALVGVVLPTYASLEAAICREANNTFEVASTSSLGVAGVATAYVAWLGPAAGTITLGAAALTVGLPIAAIGVGVAYFYSRYRGQKAAEAAEEYARQILTGYIDDFIQNVLKPEFFPRIAALNEGIARSIVTSFSEAAKRGVPGELDDLLRTARGLRQAVAYES